MGGVLGDGAEIQLKAVEAGMLGSIVGDALGVPVEFRSRQELLDNPVTGMRSFGTHLQPAGTWSDDTSLALCLAESLAVKGVDYRDQASRFVGWVRKGLWTPHGEVFDIGGTTKQAIFNLGSGVEPIEAGPTNNRSCGNGSLMRILPVGLYFAFADKDERAKVAGNCSRLTHGHARCQLACIMFTEIVASLVRGDSFESATEDGREILIEYLGSKFPEESASFERIMSASFYDFEEANISSSGYVIDCLEASLWCTQRAENFSEGVLQAVNLGDDTDTTAAVTGALLGLRFGIQQIPEDWIDTIVRLSDIRSLILSFQDSCLQKWQTGQP